MQIFKCVSFLELCGFLYVLDGRPRVRPREVGGVVTAICALDLDGIRSHQNASRGVRGPIALIVKPERDQRVRVRVTKEHPVAKVRPVREVEDIVEELRDTHHVIVLGVCVYVDAAIV